MQSDHSMVAGIEIPFSTERGRKYASVQAWRAFFTGEKSAEELLFPERYRVDALPTGAPIFRTPDGQLTGNPADGTFVGLLTGTTNDGHCGSVFMTGSLTVSLNDVQRRFDSNGMILPISIGDRIHYASRRLYRDFIAEGWTVGQSPSPEIPTYYVIGVHGEQLHLTSSNSAAGDVARCLSTRYEFPTYDGYPLITPFTTEGICHLDQTLLSLIGESTHDHAMAGDLVINHVGKVFEIINVDDSVGEPSLLLLKATRLCPIDTILKCEQKSMIMIPHTSNMWTMRHRFNPDCLFLPRLRPPLVKLRDRLARTMDYVLDMELYDPHVAAVNAVNDFTRARMREAGVFRRLLPPLEITGFD